VSLVGYTSHIVPNPSFVDPHFVGSSWSDFPHVPGVPTHSLETPSRCSHLLLPVPEPDLFLALSWSATPVALATGMLVEHCSVLVLDELGLRRSRWFVIGGPTSFLVLHGLVLPRFLGSVAGTGPSMLDFLGFPPGLPSMCVIPGLAPLFPSLPQSPESLCGWGPRSRFYGSSATRLWGLWASSLEEASSLFFVYLKPWLGDPASIRTQEARPLRALANANRRTLPRPSWRPPRHKPFGILGLILR